MSFLLTFSGTYSIINPIYATGLFLYPLKIWGFLMFSGGIKRDQRHRFLQITLDIYLLAETTLYILYPYIYCIYTLKFV